MSDAAKNFAYSTVLTAPSPAASGTELVLAAGGGAKMPAVPFNATVWPVDVRPLDSNSEIVRVTAIATDTLTITRTQEGTSARTIVAGDQFAQTLTAKTLDDKESTSNKDATGGYAGLTLFKLNLRNTLDTITSWFTTAATAAHTWTLPDKDGTVAMTSDVTAIDNNASYRTILFSAGVLSSGAAAGTKTFQGNAGMPLSGATGTSNLSNNVFYFDPTLYPTINGATAKLLVTGETHCNDVAPAVTLVFGMNAVTRPATSGGVGQVLYTIGAAVTGSNGATITTPAADSSVASTGQALFEMPGAGWYCLTVVQTDAVAASATVHVRSTLYMRN